MGNLQVACFGAAAANRRDPRICLVRADGGGPQELMVPAGSAAIRAGDVMVAGMKSPNLLVCHASCLRVGGRPVPLPPDRELQPGHLYFLLPLRAFQSKLPWSYLAMLASKATLPPAAPAPAPAPAAPAPAPPSISSGGSPDHAPLSLHSQSNHISPLPPSSPPHSCRRNNVCHSPDVLSRYIDQLIARGTCWRPDLDTIQEINRL